LPVVSPARFGAAAVDQAGVILSSRGNNRSAGVCEVRIRIERAACVGNARCAAVAGALYPLNDDGYIDSDGFTVEPGSELLARNGAKACPERIIFVIEDDDSQSWPPVRSS
jgi:ferredoxin